MKISTNCMKCGGPLSTNGICMKGCDERNSLTDLPGGGHGGPVGFVPPAMDLTLGVINELAAINSTLKEIANLLEGMTRIVGRSGG